MVTDEPRLQALYDFWDEKRAGRVMPARADFDPLELKPWMGHLSLVETLDGGNDFLFRVHGTVLAWRLVGEDLTGRRLMELPYDWKEVWREEYRRVVRTRAPYAVTRKASAMKDHVGIRKLILPLSDDGETVDMLLYGVYEHKL